ncbi:MAG TPA: aspartate kinase, partial [Algoriphagus sp.]|nr:aspartate kinase [Algoriphagus sp.]
QQLFKLEQLVNSLKNKFIIRYNEGLELLTVLHPDRKDFSDLNPGYEILLEQSTRNTVQFVRRKE